MKIPEILIHFQNLELKMHLSQFFCGSKFNALMFSKGVEHYSKEDIAILQWNIDLQNRKY